MNAEIGRFEFIPDGDLMLCQNNGVAYQSDMSQRIRYDDSYLYKFVAYDRETARAVNAGRVAMLSRHLTHGASVLDVGAGDGEFVRAARAARFNAKGYEVIPAAANALKLAGLYDNQPRGYDAVTLWDVLEHMEDPAPWLASISRPSAMLFVSLPIFEDLRHIRESRHYRPGEHFYYFTDQGFVSWIELYGFTLVERSWHEIEAGRESIGAFAFRLAGRIVN